MYFRGMSDWNLAKLEDIDWDVFVRSDDHIVPHQGIELLGGSSASCDSQKKPKHEVKNDVGKNMYSRGSTIKTVLWGDEETYCPPRKNGSLAMSEGSTSHTSNVLVPILCDLESTANGTAFPSEDRRILDSFVNESSSNCERHIFCSKDPSLGTSVSTNDGKPCVSSLNGVSPYVTDLSLLENNQKPRDDDLAYYDWPDIGNFEDIDKINWDSTFGHGQTGTADDLSWLSSSSNTIYGSEVASQTGYQSSSLDLGALCPRLESRHPNTEFLSESVPATAHHNKPTTSNYTDWLGTDAPSEAKSVGKEKIFGGGDKIHNTRLTQINNEYSLNRSETSGVEKECEQLTEDRGTQISRDQMLLDSDVSAPQMYFPQQISQQKHFVGSPSSYMHHLDAHSQLEFGLPAHQLPFTQISSTVEAGKGTNPSLSYRFSDRIVKHPSQYLESSPDQLYMPQVMTSEEDLDKLYQRQQICGALAAEQPHQPVFQSKASVQKKLLETRDDTEMEAVVGIDHPIAQECYGRTSVSSDDISKKVTSFRQLHDVMHQLDVRTKLCIRDSLYRLARSARQRHDFTMQNCSEETVDAKGVQGTEASKRSAEFMNTETNTNPIDRSIAHLLFHKPSDPATKSADAKSLESGVMNGQVHGLITNHVLVAGQFDHQRTFGGCSDMETDLP